MADDAKAKVEETTAKTTEAPAPAEKPAAELTVQDLQALKQIIDVSTQRGAFKGNELMSVGQVYNKLEVFLNSVQAQAAPQGEQTNGN
tara:strand:+ start:1336 stop:1599 length:264 start_codon:yes stop_codon:yes gene_type:complete